MHLPHQYSKPNTEEATARQCPALGAIRAQLVPLKPASSIALFAVPLHALWHPGRSNPQALKEKRRPVFLKRSPCMRRVNHSVRYDCSTPPWAVVGWGRPHRCAHATPAACWDRATPGADILRAMWPHLALHGWHQRKACDARSMLTACPVHNHRHVCSCCSQERQGFCQVHGNAAGPKILCEGKIPLGYHLVQLVTHLVMRSGCQMSDT